MIIEMAVRPAIVCIRTEVLEQLVAHAAPEAARMPSLLISIFAIELAVQLINSIGAATINNLVRL